MSGWEDLTEQQRAQMLELEAMSTEPLHEDLEPWVEESPRFGKALRHPLVYSIPLMLPGMANRQYHQKVKMLARARAEQDWHTFVFLYERPYRFEAVQQIAEETGKPDWDLLRDVWIDSENIWQHQTEWDSILREPEAHQMMLESEAQRLASLPETVDIYRGAILEVNEDGLSYTLDYDRALFFARYRRLADDERVVIHAEVDREHIVALLDGRNEHEVLILPEHVRIRHYEEVEQS